MSWTVVTPSDAACASAARAPASVSSNDVGRHGTRHQLHRVVLEDAGELAGRVLDDRTTVGHRRVAGDSRERQGARVGDAHVPVEPLDEHRVVRRGRVDLGARRQRVVRPASWSQKPPSIQRPAGSFAAKAVTLACISADEAASRRLTLSRSLAPSRRCTCASLKPGTTRRPCASMTRAPGGTAARISCVVPTATIVSPQTATASAQGLA